MKANCSSINDQTKGTLVESRSPQRSHQTTAQDSDVKKKDLVSSKLNAHLIPVTSTLAFKALGSCFTGENPFGFFIKQYVLLKLFIYMIFCLCVDNKLSVGWNLLWLLRSSEPARINTRRDSWISVMLPPSRVSLLKLLKSGPLP